MRLKRRLILKNGILTAVMPKKGALRQFATCFMISVSKVAGIAEVHLDLLLYMDMSHLVSLQRLRASQIGT